MTLRLCSSRLQRRACLVRAARMVVTHTCSSCLLVLAPLHTPSVSVVAQSGSKKCPCSLLSSLCRAHFSFLLLRAGLETAIALWKELLTGRFALVDKWCEFAEVSPNASCAELPRRVLFAGCSLSFGRYSFECYSLFSVAIVAHSVTAFVHVP
jgi:hypothetical protein